MTLITDNIKVYNESCFDTFKRIDDNTVDLIIVDLPYGQTSCSWDELIDLDEMWKELKRICKKKCNYIFFCSTKFGYKLIKSNEKWFRYDLVWKKSRKVGFLSANKMPLRQHEMIYVFGDNRDDVEIERNKELRDYSKNIYKEIGKSKKEIEKDMGNNHLDHFFRFSSSQFSLPTEKNYIKLIKLYNLDKLDYYMDYKTLKDKLEISVYNPQKTKGKPYKIKGNENNLSNSYYRGGDKQYGTLDIENTGERHPTSIIECEPEHEMIYVFGDDKSKKGDYNPQKTKLDKPYKNKRNNKRNNSKIPRIYGNGKLPEESNYTNRHPTSVLEEEKEYSNTLLEFNNPKKSLHPTQKPVSLYNFLINSYSNKGDLVMDFCLGSGTGVISAIQCERKFIGCELDEKYFSIIKQRIDDELRKE